MKRMIKRSPIPAVGKRTPFGVLIIINLYILWYEKKPINDGLWLYKIIKRLL